MSKYRKLDADILDFIWRSGEPVTWMQIYGEFASRNEVNDNWRVIDGRIQALRRAGKISFERRGNLCLWSLA